ncbi:MFS transporter [Streptomyces sp. MBT53]|uniref:MFS transporter n=1 Tax=Streptomyces sp. MBT53 TaxID=1488384 RepID=UPI001914AEAA|nr:MFS transporter [Streptomyces sp. MBT53]MBK6013842.1 MFS transporter [Streptomyces sp. MBT53]
MSAPSSTPTPACPSYAAVLQVPYARRTFTAALVGRLSYGTVSPAVLLAVVHSTGSYAAAGTVMAVFGTATVLLLPLRAALVDRHGPRRALLPMALLYGTLLCVLAAVTWRPGTPEVVLGTVAALTGMCAPPLGPTMRSVWAELVGDQGLLRRAYSLDGVAEELLYVVGPLAIGALMSFAPPAAGVLLSAVLIGAGTFAFVTSPALAGVRVPAGGGRGLRLSRVRGLLGPVVVAAGTGLALSAVYLLVMAFAEQRGYGDGVVPWVLAALSAGSAVGGLLNGAVDWRRAARVRLALSALGLGLALAAAGPAAGVWSLTVAVACAGFFVAPALTTAYLLADEVAAPEVRTQAGAWVNMAVNAGSSGGSVVTGLLIGRVPVGVCFVIAGVVAVVAGASSVVRVPVRRGWSRPRAGAAIDTAPRA